MNPSLLDRQLQTKPISSLPDYLERDIHLISLTKKDDMIHPYGSSTYRVQKYFGDIDLVEKFQYETTVEGVIKKFVTSLKKIVKNISSKKLHYFSEFKAGIDSTYDFYIGDLKNGIFNFVPSAQEIVLFLIEEGYFNDYESSLLYFIIEKSKMKQLTQNDYDVVYNIIRERRILRWTEEEILSGKKKVSYGVIKLSEALSMTGSVKIDMIIILEGNFVEISNYLFLGAIDKKGQLIALNGDPDPSNEHIVDSLTKEVDKLYSSNYYYSPFKCAKRMFSISRIEYINNLYNPTQLKFWLGPLINLISGDLSFLYQIMSELSVLLRVINLKKFPQKAVHNQLESIKYKLANVVQISNKSLRIINNLIEKINSSSSLDYKARKISVIYSAIKRRISSETVKFFAKNLFDPPPLHFYPALFKYKRESRYLKGRPVDPFKLLEKELDEYHNGVNILENKEPENNDDLVIEYIDDNFDNHDDLEDNLEPEDLEDDIEEVDYIKPYYDKIREGDLELEELFKKYNEKLANYNLAVKQKEESNNKGINITTGNVAKLGSELYFLKDLVNSADERLNETIKNTSDDVLTKIYDNRIYYEISDRTRGLIINKLNP